MKRTATQELEAYYRREREMERGFQTRLHLERKYLLERLYEYVIWINNEFRREEIYYPRPERMGAQGVYEKEITKEDAERMNRAVLQKIKMKNSRRK